MVALDKFFLYVIAVVSHQNMTFLQSWDRAVDKAGAPLCVGLDPLPEKLPTHLDSSPEGVWHFLEEIVRATSDIAAAYKPNLAFFEALGTAGWEMLEKLRALLPSHALLIADGKLGDISSTSELYATAIFERIHADAVTVNPYLGGEALEPFLRRPEKGVLVLCATSNPGAKEFQELPVADGFLFEEVARRARVWNRNGNVGLVVGTTRPDALTRIQQLAPELPLLLPGSGAQGGSAKDVARLLSKNPQSRGLFVWARSILYASSGEDFAAAAREAAIKCRNELL